LEKHVKELSKGDVLDIGTGSGIQAEAAASNSKVKSVLAADIQKEVIVHCKQTIKNKKITFKVSDLFKNVKGKFDTIIFNPPYLPNELNLKDIRLDGGKKGYEVIGNFLNSVNEYLKPDGVVMIVFSLLSKKDKVDEFIANNMLEFEELSKEHIFFEDIYVYKIWKNDVLKEVEKKGVSDVKKLTKGHRGLIYTGKYKGSKVAIKVKNPKSEAIGRIVNEINNLKVLDKKNIGPKLLFCSEDHFVYKFVSGKMILDYISGEGKMNVIKVLKDVFNQMFVLDKLKINKEEMHHPLKHVIVGRKPVLIDFERANTAYKPHNVTQFCQFVMSSHKLLSSKNIKVSRKELIELSKKYKRNPTKENFEGIVKLLK